MKIKKNFILREVAGNVVVVPTGKATLDFSGMITLNESGAFLWNLLENERSEEELVAALLGEYEVDEATAKKDVADFLTVLKTNGLMDGFVGPGRD